MVSVVSAMLTYPDIDPIIFQLGPLAVRWYGLMYVLGFLAAFFLVRYQFRRYPHPGLAEHFDNLNLILIVSLILGARIGYVALYNLPYYWQNPLEILAIWQGGMSFHGGLLGALGGGWLFCHYRGLNFLRTADAYVVPAPIGLIFGRLGNFINAELYGRVSDVPWAMVFPGGGPLPRHPSQLYQSFFEGLILFVIMWYALKLYWQRQWPAGRLVVVFLVGYGVFRFAVEFFRQPDANLSLLFGVFTLGQVLSLLMIVTGILLWQVLTVRQRKRQ